MERQTYTQKLKARGFLGKNRTEKNSGKPIAMPVGFQRPPTLAEQVARLVRSNDLARYAQSQGLETFEEADDFDIPDDPFPISTPYEQDFDHASVAAMDRGVVERPSNESLEKSKTLLTEGFKKLKEKKAAKQSAAVQSPSEVPPKSEA